jgi:hypothetical protein
VVRGFAETGVKRFGETVSFLLLKVVFAAIVLYLGKISLL